MAYSNDYDNYLFFYYLKDNTVASNPKTKLTAVFSFERFNIVFQFVRVSCQ